MNPEEQRDLTVEFLESVLYDHWAPDDPDPREFIDLAARRIDTDGASQYYDPTTDTMLFETMEPGRLYEFTEEEALDIANYAFMLEARSVHPGEKLLADQLVNTAYRLWTTVHDGRLNREGADRVKLAYERDGEAQTAL